MHELPILWPLTRERGRLESAYYEGIRFMIDTRAESDERLPIADGGAFDWVQRLASNDRLTFVASGLGHAVAGHGAGSRMTA